MAIPGRKPSAQKISVKTICRMKSAGVGADWRFLFWLFLRRYLTAPGEVRCNEGLADA
jgi:hypothetical protein